MTKEQKKQLYGFGLPIILGTILLLGASYAWLQLTLNGTKTNVLKVESLSLELDDEESVGIDGEDIVPVLDEVGLLQDPYRFTLINKGNIDSEYTIYLDDVDLLDKEIRLPDTAIKYNLEKDGSELATKLLSATIVEEKRVLDTGVIGAGEEYVYDLRMWINSEAKREEAAGKTFRGKIRVEAQQVIEQPPTPEECFAFDSKTGTITEYLCGPKVVKNGSIVTNTSSPVGKTISDVVIPKTIQGVNVENIGYSDSDNEKCQSDNYCSSGGSPFSFQSEGIDITSVVIPEGVKMIGYFAFSENNLTSVKIPKSVTTIDEYAFYGNQLTNITLSSTVQEIGYSVFAANKLTKVTIPSSVTVLGAGAFGNNPLTNVVIKGKTGPSDFASYGIYKYYNVSPFYDNDYMKGWLEGSNCAAHYAANKTKENEYWGDGTNPCIHWEGKN